MFEPSTVVKVPVVFNVTLAALMLPAILPSLAVRVVWPLFGVMLELAWVVNLPLSAVMVTALPETLPTLSVSPLAVISTSPELDLTSPLISPVWVVILALPVVALIVVPSVVVTAPELAVTVTF